MNFQVCRYSTSPDSTLGILYRIDYDSSEISKRQFLCYTLEDTYHEEKVYGETRIPSGQYELKFRTVGGFHSRYLSRYGESFHEGMIHVQDVPGFDYILWHVGNDKSDTNGCLLLGDSSSENAVGEGGIGSSRNAYKRVYPIVRDAIKEGSCHVDYINLDE